LLAWLRGGGSAGADEGGGLVAPKGRDERGVAHRRGGILLARSQSALLVRRGRCAADAQARGRSIEERVPSAVLVVVALDSVEIQGLTQPNLPLLLLRHATLLQLRTAVQQRPKDILLPRIALRLHHIKIIPPAQHRIDVLRGGGRPQRAHLGFAQLQHILQLRHSTPQHTLL
jgi:hypothetical protein